VAGSLRSVVAFVAYSLVFGAISGNTDNAAHGGGLISGLVMGALLARLAPDSSAWARRVAVIIAGATAVYGGWLWLQHARGYQMLVERADQLLYQNKGSESIAELQAIIRKQPSLATAHFALAHAYFNSRQYSQAEVELQRVLELEPQNRLASYELGITYLDHNRLADAKKVFAETLSKDPSNADAHLGLGLELAAEQNHLAAIQEFNTALKLDPELSGIYYEIGHSYAMLNKVDDAIAAFIKERQLNGDDQYIEIGLAAAYKSNGMAAEAKDAQTKAERLSKTEANQ